MALPDTDFAVEYQGQWMSYEQFLDARLDALMPRQPKRQWGGYRVKPAAGGVDKCAEYRRQMLDARHQ